MAKKRRSAAVYCRLLHDDFGGEDDIGAVRAKIELMLIDRAGHLTLLGVECHMRGGFAVHFDCAEGDRIMLTGLLEDGGFRQVI